MRKLHAPILDEWGNDGLYEDPDGLYVAANAVEDMIMDFKRIQDYVEINYPENHTLINMIKNAIKKVEE